MKKTLFLLVMLAVTAMSSAQTIVFHENFDPASNADSVTTSGSTNFSINTRLFNSSPQCDSLEVSMSGVSYMTSQSFSTVGFPNVVLEFSHICKIEIFDTAKIQVSIDGGVTWVQLTTQYINPGDAQFSNQSYRFSANTYPTLWLPGTATAKPQQSWWRNEIFDISGIAANQADVRVRLVLIDGDADGSSQNMGWYVDNIRVTGAISELFPPKITMKAPIIQDTISNTGPFNIYAYIKDVSGIDTAYLQYQLNGGAIQYIPMLWVSDSTYLGTIPSYTYNNRIDYTVYAVDNSLSHNSASSSNYWFYIKKILFIALGNGTSSSYTYGPIYRLSATSTTDFSRYFYLFPASELTAAGIPNGANITKVEWYKTDVNSTLGNANFKIYMKNSVQTVLASTPWATLITGATQVYSSTTQAIPAVAGWLPFSVTPYPYTGQGLEIGTDWDISAVAGDPTTGPFNFQYTTGYPVYNIRGTGTTAPVTLGTTSTYRPNIRIYYTVQGLTEDAGVNEILTPSGTLLTGVNYPVTLNIKNFAVDSLKKVTIAWELDGVLQTPYNWTGVLLEDVVSNTINMGNANLATIGSHTIRAWTVLPNDSVDENHTNDTASISFYACSSLLNGTYTIGASGADFPSFNAALNSLQNCGISGPVTFNVQSGTYNEQLIFPEINGASATNTITFQSLTGVNTDVVLQDTTDATTNYVVLLDGADHFRFRNMTLQSVATTAYSRVIELTGNAIDNQFDGNIISGPAATASSVNTALVYSTSGATSLDSLSVFNNNTLAGGSYGLYLYGASTTVLENNTTITNNTFNNQYSYAMRLYYQYSPTISGNIINGHATNTGYYGIYAGYCDYDLKILENKITIPNGGYGVYLYYCDGVSGYEGLTANNFISIGGSTITYGIYNGYSTFQNIYYNSVNIYTDFTTARAVHMVGTTYPNHNYKNNIFAYTGVNASGMAFYVTTPANVTSSDYNDLYTTGTNLGYWGANVADLAAWQIASSMDAHSVSVDPNYTTPTDLHTFYAGLDGLATPISGITDDIDGETRNASTPDIGADEFTPLADDLGISSVIAPIGGCGLGATENVTIQLKNFGGTTITTADIYYVLNNGTPVHGVFNGSIAPNATYDYTFPQQANLSAISNYTFKFYVVLTGDENALNDTISDYTISNGWDFAAADYTMGFEPGEEVSNWSVINTDASTYKWEIPYSSSTYSHTGTYSARFYNSATNTGEDWLFSRCFYLEAGKTYSLSFWYRSYGATSPQTISLKYGNSASIAAMTTTLTTLTAIINTAHEQSVSQFTVPSSGIYYFGWSGVAGLANYAYIDDINIKVIPDQEVALEKILTPNSGCGLSASENVTIKIKNTGSDTIAGNLSAYYSINNTTPVSAAVPGQILPGDTLLFTFPVGADLSVTTMDSTFNFKVWVSLLNDPIHTNDTLTKEVESLHIPALPVVTNDTVSYGQAATLQAFSAATVNWYVDDTTTSYFHQGTSYVTPPLFDTVTYFVNAISGASSQYVGPYDYSIGTSSTYANTTYYMFFDVLDPNGVSIQSMDIFPSTAPGAAYSIQLLNSGGTLLQTYNGVTTVASGQRETAPVDFTVPYGTEYRVKFGVSSGFYRNTTGATYPYVIPNVISINGNSFANLQYYYFFYNWKIGGGGCSSERVPVTAYVEFPANEISVKRIISPVDACTYGTEIVKATFGNSGTDTINTPFTAGYFISGNPVPVTETVNTPILPGDSIDYTFITPANMPVLFGDSVYSVKVFASVAGDPYQVNDTLIKNVTLTFTPPDPIGLNDTVLYGTAATLTATSPYDIFWYDVPVGGSSIIQDSSLTTPILYSTTVYYAEVKTLGTPDSLSTIFTGGTSCQGGNMFDLQPVSSPLTITGFNIRPQAAGAQTVKVYYKTGTYVGAELDSANWTVLGTFSINVATALTRTYVDITDFVIPAGQVTGIFLNFYASYTSIPTATTYSNADLQLTSGAGLCGAFSGLNANRAFNGDVFYTPYGCSSNRVPVTAVITGQPNVDAGLIAFTEPGSPISLGYHDVKVILKNYGLDTLHSVAINYSVNGIAQTPFNWTGALPTNTTDTVTIANHNFVFTPYPGLNDLVAWTENPNSVADPTTANDTISTVIDAHNPLNGVYYILTATPDFNSFSEAVTVLNAWGVSGHVTMVADAGTYNEHISLTAIPGASDTSTVTFRSINNISTEVSLEFAATGTGDNYVVQLDGADYIRFKNMTIKSTSTTAYGRVVELKNAATNNIFEGNIIESIEATTSSSSPVYCNTVDCDFNTFIGNDLLNGYYGAYFSGISTNRYQGLQFINNNFINYYYYGLYTNYTDSLQVIGNNLSTSSVSTTNYSVYAYYPDNNARFEKNRVEYNGTGSFYGIYLYNGNAAASIPNWVANNFVSNTGSSGTAYGIYLSGNNYVNVYYNSTNITAGSTTASRGLYQTGGTSNVNIMNNNFANTAGGYTFYISTPAAVNASDYNNHYTTGAVLAYWGAARNTLALLQAASGKDVHSITVQPLYLSVSDLHTYQFLLYASAYPVAGITTDIDGDTRDIITPCIGADEFKLPKLDAGVSIINTPSNPAVGGLQPVKVTIQNFGMDTIHNVAITYELDGVVVGTYNWAGTLLSNDTIMNVNVGDVTLLAGNSIIRAWTSMPNFTMDTNNYNDTASSSIIICGGPLSGTYTIGGASPDYFTFNDAVTAMNYCGIGGPVVFNVANGTYTERLNIGLIAGMSATNTVTFQSASGVNTDVILQAAGTGTANNYVVQLNGAIYTSFKNMTLKSITASTYGRVVTVLNNSDYNSFEGNKIQSIVTTSTNASTVYTTGGNMDYNRFIGNEISGGYYGVYWYASSSALNKNTEFRNNSITGWYYYGMYLYYNDSIIVDGNTIQNGSNSSTGYAVYSYYGDNGCRYEKNHIHATNTGTFYGLGILSNDGTADEPTVIANNMISEVNGTGTAYGIYLSSSNYANAYYNSVNIKGGSSTAGRSLYVTGGGNIRLLNNNLVNSGLGYAYYNATSAAIVQSDYNNIYSTSATVYAYWGTARINLDSLQVASGLDSNSISLDPVFVSVSDLHLYSVGLDGKAIPIADITTDIDGDIRNALTPDIGADEYDVLPKNIGVVAFVRPNTQFGPVGSNKIVEVQIRNLGSDTVTTFAITYKYGTGTPVVQTWNGTLLPNEVINHTFTVQFTTLEGLHNLCAYTALPGDGDLSNDTLCMDYTGVPIFDVPYIDNFEGTVSWLGSGTNNLWEWGVPTATLIDSAYSPVHAWVTNLDGNYVNSTTEYLYSPYFMFNGIDSAYLEFWHWYNTESNYDGGRIEYSINGGTWTILGTQADPNAVNWYNASVSSIPCWSGNSNGYVHSKFRLTSIPAIVNSVAPVQFRFKFFSDVSNVFEGWAVDNVEISVPPIPYDAGVTAILQPNAATQTGSPVIVQVTIKNYGTSPLVSVPVRYVVNGGAVTAETWSGSLAPNATVNYTFTAPFTSPGLTYELCAFTRLTYDNYTFNDSTCASFGTTPAPHDVGIVAILSPGPVTIYGQADTVKVRIKNYGLSPETSIPLVFTRNFVQIGAGIWTGTVNGGDSVDYTFTTTSISPIGNYSLCSKTTMAGDANTANDETCIYANGQVGIETYDYSGFELYQNVPNPAGNNTHIVFYVPEGDKVRFEMYDLLGKAIRAEDIDAVRGENQIDLNASIMPDGIYFYSVAYKGQKLTKRMVVAK